MSKKEINIFNISFLDLLSGALGAVIILYIIIPKLNAENVELLYEAEELQKKAKNIEEILNNLERAIPQEIYEEIEEHISKLREEVDALQNTINHLVEQVEELQKQLAACQKEVEALKKKVQELEQRVASLESQLEKCKEENQALQAENQKLTTENDNLQTQLDKCKETNTALQTQNQELTAENTRLQGDLRDLDVGFKFGKKKRIVFAIDISGSMQDNDKIGQVKAGLKLLVSTMDNSFYVDVVAFPNGGSDYGFTYLWGQTTPMNQRNKNLLFNFLYSLRPNGGTPVNGVLTGIFRRYSDLSDIVLLCDGEPTDANPNEILNNIRSINRGNIRVNTIGVGEEYLNNLNHQKVIFLRDLAQQNNGFFIGF